MSAIAQWLAHSLLLPFLGIGMRINLFQSCVHCWVFHICSHIECNTLMASSFMVLNCSTGIPSHPLALLTAVLPKAHQTVTLQHVWLWHRHSNLVHLDVLYSSSMYSFHLFLISSASTKSLPFISFIVPIFGQNLPLISPILLKRSLVFPLLLFSSIFIH